MDDADDGGGDDADDDEDLRLSFLYIYKLPMEIGSGWGRLAGRIGDLPSETSTLVPRRQGMVKRYPEHEGSLTCFSYNILLGKLLLA